MLNSHGRPPRLPPPPVPPRKKMKKRLTGIILRHRRAIAIVAVAASGVPLLSFCLVWWWMNAQVVPQEAIDAFCGSVVFLDCHGRELSIRRGSDYRWIFPVALTEVPEQMQRDVIAVEDRNFYRHHGVDYRAMARAFWQFVSTGRIVSGGSTITMQVVNQYCGRGRGIIYKLRQMGMALNWERTHSKADILGDYFNMLPYGGKLCGIEAAARYYYGRSARDLNRSEQLLLTGLPQSPNRFRPDRFVRRAIWRRDVVLVILQRAGHVTADEAAQIRAMPLRFRDFTLPAWPSQVENEFTGMVLSRSPLRQSYRTTLDPALQNLLRAHLAAGRDALPGVNDGAGVVIENASGKVRALVGTLPGGDQRSQAINAALSWRSPGSALKPFIYGEAINGGLITAATILEDTPMAFGDYHPVNYDGQFRGDVAARDALADSLNIPAIRLLRRLGVKRMIRLLQPMGIFAPDAKATAEQIGLTLALGGIESQLLALASAYSSLGTIRHPQLLEDWPSGAGEPARYWLPGTVELLLEMLCSRPLPGAEGMKVAWKTGTSNGNRDAWCFSVTPKWTVAVWYGNKSGAPAPALVGGSAAAPVAGAIQRYLHQGALPQWPQDTGRLKQVALCPRSGLAASLFCEKSIPGMAVAAIPLAQCRRCGDERIGATRLQATLVHSPASGSYCATRGGKARFVVKTSPSPCHLYVDGQYAGHLPGGRMIELATGRHQLLFWGGEGYSSSIVDLAVTGQ